VPETCDESGIETATGAGVEVLEARLTVLELGLGEKPGEAPVVAMRGFAFDEQREAVLEGRRMT
jgi:hypothetical protein